MDSGLDFHTARAMLAWQVELGATEAIADAPINRYEVVEPPKPAAPAPAPQAETDPVAEARMLAEAAADLEALARVQEAFAHCELKKGARNFVFADGRPRARVMIIGDCPGRDEDMQGRPFAGAAGQLLGRMLGAIGLALDAPDLENAVYVTCALPWRTPQNRRASEEELAMMRPFVERHIDLSAPEVLVLMGAAPCAMLLGRDTVRAMRGTWAEVMGLPTLPMCDPAFLLRNPAAKRDAWSDLLALQARLRHA